MDHGGKHDEDHAEPDTAPDPRHQRLPKSPAGRVRRMTRKRTSPTASRYAPPTTTTLAASATPRRRPPAKLPKSDPSPARTTTMSALRVHSRPIDGLME